MGSEAKMQSKQLFPSDILPSDITLRFPSGYTCRPLKSADYKAGILDVLRVLTKVGDVTEDEFVDRFEWMRKRNEYDGFQVEDAVEKIKCEGEYFIVVIEDQDGRVVGTGSLLVERKFIRSLGSVGHIEDITVAKDQQGKKFGLLLIQLLDKLASDLGCYKAILDCSEANEGFYVKCGFKRAGLYMAHYYD